MLFIAGSSTPTLSSGKYLWFNQGLSKCEKRAAEEIRHMAKFSMFPTCELIKYDWM